MQVDLSERSNALLFQGKPECRRGLRFGSSWRNLARHGRLGRTQTLAGPYRCPLNVCWGRLGSGAALGALCSRMAEQPTLKGGTSHVVVFKRLLDPG